MSSVRWPLVIALAVAYFGTTGAAVFGLFRLRENIIAKESTPAAIHEWQIWQEESNRLARESGRKPVTANEPPALILLRDHFGPILGTVAVISTGLFAFILLVLWSRIRVP
jgi:hypothetical protein